MGTFEKLGILVIVVIIVMIMAVAIYQWGGPESQLDFGPFTAVSPAAAAEQDPPLEVDYLPDAGRESAAGRAAVPDSLRIPNGRRSVEAPGHMPAPDRRGLCAGTDRDDNSARLSDRCKARRGRLYDRHGRR